jgi:callose synthase
MVAMIQHGSKLHCYCRYNHFGIVLYLCKLTFDYQFVVQTLVETTLFVYSADSTDYLTYAHFLLQFSFHNIRYTPY